MNLLKKTRPKSDEKKQKRKIVEENLYNFLKKPGKWFLMGLKAKYF